MQSSSASPSDVPPDQSGRVSSCGNSTHHEHRVVGEQTQGRWTGGAWESCQSGRSPSRFDKCQECEHYRSEHAPAPDPVCGCDVLGPFGEWHVCPCPSFVEVPDA